MSKDAERPFSLWRQDDALRAGQLIYQAIPVASRPSWAGAVLEVCKERHGPVAEVEAVGELAWIEEEWPKGHEAFTRARLLTLAYESGDKDDPVYEALLFVAENAAKVIYNASGRSAPFDRDCGTWLVVNARNMVEVVKEERFERRVWQALLGPIRKEGAA